MQVFWVTDDQYGWLPVQHIQKQSAGEKGREEATGVAGRRLQTGGR